MERKEFAVFAAALKTYFPKNNILPTEQAMELWYKALGDIPYNVAETALMQYVQTNKFPPSIAEIRELASQIEHGRDKDWSEAWEETLKAISRYGRNNKEKAMARLDEATQKTVERLGYGYLCRSENLSVDRANFREIYQTIVKRQSESNALSATIRLMLEGKNNG